MKLERFVVPGLAHYSYVVASQDKAAVVDPRRDVDVYQDYAAANGLKITHILETHIHADYASGARELAARTGAKLWLSGHDTGEDFEYSFPHHEFRDGEELMLGGTRIVALHTPGHTPEHLSFLLYEEGGRKQPMAMLSGDFVFVGSLGRPDLLGEGAKYKLAGQLYESVHQKIAAMPDGLEIHPAHGAGSMCGAGMGERPQTTLGYERATNVFFAPRSQNEFVDLILGSVPPFPEYYKRMKRVNSEGLLLPELPGGAALSPEEFRKQAEDKQAVVIDLRRPEAFGGAHVPGAFSIGGDQNLAMWAAWMVPYDRPILLVGDEAASYEEARRSLVRVGLDDIRGHLRGGMKSWILAGYPQEHVAQISVTELAARNGKGDLYVLDVRSDREWKSGHVAGAMHIMASDLPQQLDSLPRDRTVHIICGSGYRSSIASSVMKRAGRSNVVNMVGGMTAWTGAGLPTVT
ncbi:MAG: MBL fold metallo-hydrolase [Terriglobales bacterium]